MSFLTEIAKLYPGEVVALVEVDGTSFGADIYRFHNENIEMSENDIIALENGNSVTKTINWRGEVYGPRPFGVTGLVMSSNSTPSKPQLRVSNIDGQVSALCARYDNMVLAKVIVWITIGKFLDDGTEPNTEEYRRFVFYVDRKASSNPEWTIFDLSSPYDMTGLTIPARPLQAGCYWAHRGWYKSGKGCDYSGSNYFDIDGNPVDDPALDVCPGTLSACKLRFGSGNPLPYGGQLSASLKK